MLAQKTFNMLSVCRGVFDLLRIPHPEVSMSPLGHPGVTVKRDIRKGKELTWENLPSSCFWLVAWKEEKVNNKRILGGFINIHRS